MTHVRVLQTVEQVTDGRVYRGEVVIGGATLQYEFSFQFLIPDWREGVDVSTLSAMHRFYGLVLKKDGVPIELTHQEYGVFANLLEDMVLDFYYQPQTRELNENLILGVMQQSSLNMKVSVGMKSGGAAYEFQPALCEMLCAPKFGCRFNQS